MNSNVQLPQTSVLCIPHVFLDVTAEKVSKAFRKQNLGHIQSVCMISKISKKNEKYNTANIAIRWFDNPQSIAARQLLAEGNEIRVYYNGPWYWNVYNYESKKTFVPRVEELIAPTLDMRLSDTTPKLNPSASEFKPKQMKPTIAEYKPKKSVNSQPKEKTLVKCEKYDIREHERRCKNLMKGVIKTGTFDFDSNVVKTTEIEISYENMSPIPPPLPKKKSLACSH